MNQNLKLTVITTSQPLPDNNLTANPCLGKASLLESPGTKAKTPYEYIFPIAQPSWPNEEFSLAYLRYTIHSRDARWEANLQRNLQLEDYMGRTTTGGYHETVDSLGEATRYPSVHTVQLSNLLRADPGSTALVTPAVMELALLFMPLSCKIQE